MRTGMEKMRRGSTSAAETVQAAVAPAPAATMMTRMRMAVMMLTTQLLAAAKLNTIAVMGEWQPLARCA